MAGPPVDRQPAAGDPLDGLTADELERWELGRVQYDRTLEVSEGLGPVFNENSCGSCHNAPLGGPGSQTVTRFGASGKKGGFEDLSQFGGSLLQALAIDDDCAEEIPVEATVTAFRVTNGTMGYGLVEAIPDADLLAIRDAQDPAYRGVAHMVESFEDPGNLRVGRFGWKAQVATILTFSADAALNEMGLTNRFIMDENDPNGVRPPDLIDCDTVPDPEDGPDAQGFDFIDRVTDFQRFLAGPPQTPKSGMSGEVIFNNLGCAVCHTPSHSTPDDAALEDAIRDATFRPYSDFLLHDMGLAADFIVQGAGTEQMLRTPALWGLRTRDPMWHDGRFAAGTFADRVTDAIMEHGAFLSQGEDAANAFAALSSGDKDLLIQFLDSLGRREFDHSGNNLIGIEDLCDFTACFGGGPYTPDDACAISDLDQDGDVDTDDLAGFVLEYEGYRGDCNENGILDIVDIAVGTSLDANCDGVPDECEPTCLADINGSGTVDVSDVLDLLAQWGDCPDLDLPCSADLNFDGMVNVSDLLFLIGNYGVCP